MQSGEHCTMAHIDVFITAPIFVRYSGMAYGNAVDTSNIE